MPPVHADVPLGQGKQEFCLWCPACPTLCWQTLGKVAFKILKGEIRAGEQPTSALCTATGLLCKMGVISTTLAAEHHCARGWRPCPNVQLLCAHSQPVLIRPPETALSSWMWLQGTVTVPLSPCLYCTA